MPSRIHLGDLAVVVVRKDIKNVHLRVHPPTGRVPKWRSFREALNRLPVRHESWGY